MADTASSVSRSKGLGQRARGGDATGSSEVIELIGSFEQLEQAVEEWRVC